MTVLIVQSYSRSLPIMPRDENIVDLELEKKLSYKVQNYLEAYLFTYIIVNNKPHPTCTLPHQMLSNDGMKSSLLVRHLKTKHSKHEHNPLEFID